MTLTHLLIESQDHNCFFRSAHSLAAAGMPTLVYLIDDGVNCLEAQPSEVSELIAKGGIVWADDTSLAERAISHDHLMTGVVPVDMDRVAPLLFDPTIRVVWH